MSYHTRKVVRPALPKDNGLPLALVRLMEMLDPTHASGVKIDAPHEHRGGCKFQLGLYATPGAVLQIGEEGKPNSMRVSVDGGTTTVTVVGGREAQTLTAPYSMEVIGQCEIPFHHIYISVYDNWYSFGVAIGDEKEELANKAYGGALKRANRIYINGQMLSYNSHCYGVQLLCNSLEFERIEYLDRKNYSFSVWERVLLACNFGQVWEEWTPAAPHIGSSDLPAVKHNSGLTWQEAVASSRPSPRRIHTNNEFQWMRPEGARTVHLWLGQAGQGGQGGSKHRGLNGAAGVGRMYRVDQDALTLHIYDGGAGGKHSKYGGGKKGEPGKHTTVDSPAWSSEGGTTATIASPIGLKRYILILPGYFAWGKTGATGITFGYYPYAMCWGGNIWRYCGGGSGGTASDDGGTDGDKGTAGVALFHYQY